MGLFSKAALCAAAIAAVSWSSVASASYLIDTGAGQDSSGDFVGRASFGTQFVAGEFTLAEASTVSSVEGFFTTSTSGLLVEKIYSASAGLPAASALYSVDISAPAKGTGWVGADGLDWSLAAGTYWLSFEVPDGSSFMGAALFNPSSPASKYAYFNGATWSSTVRPFGFRIGGEAASAAPEPASWAMMLGGFGLIGAAMRARRKVAVSFS